MTRAEQGPARHHPLAGAQSAEEGSEHRRHSARRGAAGFRAFEQPQPLLEHLNGRIAVARVKETLAVVLERGFRLRGAAVDKAGGQIERFAGFLKPAAHRTAAHQDGRLLDLGRDFGGQYLLGHRRCSSRICAVSDPRPPPGHQKTPDRRPGFLQNPRPFSALFNVARKPVGSNHHGLQWLRLRREPVKHSAQGNRVNETTG